MTRFILFAAIALMVACTVVVISGQENEVKVLKAVDKKLDIDI